ncbi:MAG: 16S rRNA (cytosine(1402)-N(4))-methyltransferase RsmH [Nocardioides sp.]
MEDSRRLHVPVLRDRVVALLAPALQRPGSVLIDATVGLGGHAEAILASCPRVSVIGVDRDRSALARAVRRLERYESRFTPVHARYDEFDSIREACGGTRVDAVLFDLGVSSMQLDEAERGFAYRLDAPLDMRMDQDSIEASHTAADVLNTYSVEELARVLRDYGEERFARRIARAVVEARTVEPFSRSSRLVKLLYDVVPAPARRTGGHPAKRTFQALRMEVNDELTGLSRALPRALEAVAAEGRVVVEAYHSLEDRLVKRAFSAVVASTAPPGLPVVPEQMRPRFRSLTRGAERAGAAEVADNSRAASVRLRAVERIRR